jgi:hypothetical protein
LESGSQIVDHFQRRDSVSAQFAEFAATCEERLFVILQVYADETATQRIAGKAQGAIMAGVAGFAAHPEQWNGFNVGWQKILRNEGITAGFHFSEFIAVNTWGPAKEGWPYKGWSEERRRNFLFALAQKAGEVHLFGIGRFVDVVAYNDIIPAARKERYRTPGTRAGQFYNPYYFCFHDFLQGVIHGTGQLDPPLSPDDTLLFMFDMLQKKWRDAAFDMFEQVKPTFDRVGRMDFCSRKDCPPLQAADLLAGVCRQGIEKAIGGIPKNELSELEKLLGAGRNLIIAYRDADALKELVTKFPG